jgi:putative transcription antitermination factor YqgF
MDRIMGLDVGDRTIGVAVSDLLMITAQGVTTIKRTNLKNDINELKKIIEEYKVTIIVSGLPKMLDGTVGIQGEKVLQFLEKMKKHIDLPVELEDNIIELINEEGKAEKLVIEATFHVDDIQYAVLHEVDSDEGMIYSLDETDDGEIILNIIDDEEELKEVIEIYEGIADELI